MRAALTLLIVLGVSAGAAAQTLGLPLPSIGLPLAEIGLPLPATGLPPTHAAAPQPPARIAPQTDDNHHRVPRGREPRGVQTFVYFVPEAGYGMLGAPLPGPPPPPLAPPPPPAGHLTIELQPGVDPQIFIDGAFAGALSDVGGELTVEPGVHHLELLGDGYEPLTVDVRIAADRTTRYRGLLTAHANPAAAISPEPRDAPSSPAPAPPATIYVIPGCYVGNLPPRQVTLPAGCDPNRASVFPSLR